MSDPSTLDSNQPRAYQWYDIWLWVMSQPSVQTFRAVRQDANATVWRAFRWVFFSGAIGALIFLLLVLPLNATFFSIVGIAMGAVGLLFLVSFVVGIRIAQAIAIRVGGNGSYADMYIIAGSYAAPLLISNLVLAPFAIRNPATATIYTIGFSIVQWGFMAIALKASNSNLRWERVMLVIAILIGISFVASGVVSLLIPAAGSLSPI